MDHEFEKKLQMLKHEEIEIPDEVRNKLDRTYQKIEMNKLKKRRFRKNRVGIVLAAVVLLILIGFSPIAKAVDNYIKFGQFTSKTLKDEGFVAKPAETVKSSGIKIVLEEAYLDQKQLGLHFMVMIPKDSDLNSDQIDFYSLGFSIKNSEDRVLFSNVSAEGSFEGTATGNQHFDQKNHTLEITYLLNNYQEEFADSGDLSIEITRISGVVQGKTEVGAGFSKVKSVATEGTWTLPLKTNSIKEFKPLDYSGVLNDNDQKVTGEAFPTMFKVVTEPFEAAKNTLDIELVSRDQSSVKTYLLSSSSIEDGLLVWYFDYPCYDQNSEVTLRIDGQDVAVLTRK
ncbi:DUF4179 domain-containing protein [Enterococcus sp. 669A]|uniref:DUF4179 domain-containing protein n=1 Tax=Candidatus Enterococcus moelleringii TaxID=2815325 RepID=A0ABS3L822_9ENTE|nr:DUF4179 domain-containing protein [Enterococcus sp. 669A]MBO1305770.1 DUF4179 domain-containing protein [Enterococcus sp. 669A]